MLLSLRRLPARSTCAWILATAVLTLGCGGDSTSPNESVASVVITGLPTGTFLVGDSARLVATAVNATGGAVSGAQIQWESSVPAVAAVRGNGTVLGLGIGTTVIKASAGRQQGTATLTVSDGGAMGSSGGNLSVGGGAVRLTVPAYSLSTSIMLLFRPATAAPADARIVAGTPWEMTPEGVYFSRGATLTLAYTPDRIPSGLPARSLQLYTQSGTLWSVIPGSTVDTTARTVSGTISRAGIYAVRSTPVDRIVLSNMSAAASLFIGQSVQINVALYSAGGDSLAGRPVAWTSSDAGKVSVDANGKLTAVAAGTATITASADGKTATVQVTVLARPTADWSRIADWLTFQGDVGHTGFVDATVDPVVFRFAWKATPQPGVALNAVTSADGKVFVTTDSYWATQFAYVLDATTGSTIWSRDFGSINSVCPPAYSNGVVYLQTSGHEDSFLWGFDASSGQIRFKTSYANQWSSYLAPTIVGQTAYVAGGYYGGMYAFNAVDGTQRWFAGLPQYDGYTPAVAGGLAYAYTGGGSGGVLTALDAATGTTIYTIADRSYSWNGYTMGMAPTLGSSNDILVMQGNRLLSFDLAGRSIRYELKGTFYGQVTIADGTLYVFNSRAVEARRESDGSLLWTWSPPSGQPTQNSIVTRNLLFVTTGSTTFAIDLASHGTVWSYPAGGALTINKQGQLLIAGSDGNLTAITLK